MSEFSILKGVTVVILVTFGKIGLLFSVYNISKNYLTFNDSWIDIYKICQSVFFSSPVSHLNVYRASLNLRVGITLLKSQFTYESPCSKNSHMEKNDTKAF